MIFDTGKGTDGRLVCLCVGTWPAARAVFACFVKGLRLFVEARSERRRVRKGDRRISRTASRLLLKIRADSAVKPAEEKSRSPMIWSSGSRGLVLLYPVPFHYLVPHQSLLPSESLRFFHLDDNWVDALVDGAFSIAVRDAGYRAQGVANRPAEYVVEDRLPAPAAIAGQATRLGSGREYMSIPKSGFLLRSRIVTAGLALKSRHRRTPRPIRTCHRSCVSIRLRMASCFVSRVARWRRDISRAARRDHFWRWQRWQIEGVEVGQGSRCAERFAASA